VNSCAPRGLRVATDREHVAPEERTGRDVLHPGHEGGEDHDGQRNAAVGTPTHRRVLSDLCRRPGVDCLVDVDRRGSTVASALNVVVSFSDTAERSAAIDL